MRAHGAPRPRRCVREHIADRRDHIGVADDGRHAGVAPARVDRTGGIGKEETRVAQRRRRRRARAGRDSRRVRGAIPGARAPARIAPGDATNAAAERRRGRQAISARPTPSGAPWATRVGRRARRARARSRIGPAGERRVEPATSHPRANWASRQPSTPRGSAPIPSLIATVRSGVGEATPRRPVCFVAAPSCQPRCIGGVVEPSKRRRRTLRGMAAAWSASSPQHAGSGYRCWNRRGRRLAPRVTLTSPARRRRLAAPRQLRRARTEAPRLRRHLPAHHSFAFAESMGPAWRRSRRARMGSVEHLRRGRYPSERGSRHRSDLSRRMVARPGPDGHLDP